MNIKIVFLTIVFIILLIIVISTIIVFKNKKIVEKSFVKNDGYFLHPLGYYTFKQDPKYLPSSQVLYWSFKSYKAPDIMYSYIKDVQDFVGVNNMIYAFKKSNINDKFLWEIYFYGFDRNRRKRISIDDVNFFITNKSMRYENYKKINKYFTIEEETEKTLEHLLKDSWIYSFDLTPEIFYNKKINNVDVYKKNLCSVIDNGKVKLKYSSIMFDFKIPGIQYLFIKKVKELGCMDMLIPNWESMGEIYIADKIIDNTISIYYSCSNMDYIISFLEKYRYHGDFIENIRKNKDKLFKYAVAENFDRNSHKVLKTSIGGSF
jgi:hypothetical protein